MQSGCLPQLYFCHNHNDADTWNKAWLQEKHAVYVAHTTPASGQFFMRIVAGAIKNSGYVKRKKGGSLLKRGKRK